MRFGEPAQVADAEDRVEVRVAQRGERRGKEGVLGVDVADRAEPAKGRRHRRG
jgi:hypothetical protein